MKTVALRSLGCKVNAYETEGMQQILQENGYFVVPFDKKADIYIVNTCSVTNIADQKSRQMLHRAKKLNPEAIVVAAGCYVQTGYEKLVEDSAIDLIIGNNEKRNIYDILEEFIRNRDMESQSNAEAKELKYVPDMSDVKEYEEMQVTTMSEHTRAFIKIQDGCNRFCTYCVIPYARGRVRSRQIDDVVREASALSVRGYQEIVLTGIHISSFGTDRGESEMLELLEKLNMIEGIKRIRLGSLEPGIITEEFAKALRNISKICPHFHLSMQSGSESVLKRMNRHYTPEEYFEKVQILRRVYDNPAITTDVIVGFPGETEEEYIETYEFCKKVNFYEMHVFKYSRRDGTVAAGMPDQIAEQTKAMRSDRLISLGEEMSSTYRKSYFGVSRDVLFEEKKSIADREYWVGHTPEYIMCAVPVTEDSKDSEKEYVNHIFAGTIGHAIDGKVVAVELR